MASMLNQQTFNRHWKLFKSLFICLIIYTLFYDSFSSIFIKIFYISGTILTVTFIRMVFRSQCHTKSNAILYITKDTFYNCYCLVRIKHELLPEQIFFIVNNDFP